MPLRVCPITIYNNVVVGIFLLTSANYLFVLL
nr:MAG TPA: hypothetical protein [Caudoviricetes sp.]